MNYVRLIILAVLCLALSGPLVFAQDGAAVALDVAPIYLRQDDTRTPLRTASKGTRFKVIAVAEDWVNVEFEDPQFGRRIGWVRRTLLRIDSAATTPMDLSVPRETPRAPDTRPVDSERESRPSAQPQANPSRRGFERGWIDVNFGGAVSGDEEHAYSFARLDAGGEPIVAAAAYGTPPLGPAFDFGGGVMVTEALGVGVTVTGTAHEDTVGMAVSVPHPFFFNAAADDAEVTDDKLLRAEGGIHPHIVFASNPTRRVRVRVSAGPSYFRYEGDRVGGIRYDQVFARFNRSNAVEITNPIVQTTEGTGWGFNVGSDVSFFFSRVVGLGGFVRYTRGTVEIFEPLSLEDEEITVGGFQFGGGLRLRF